MGRASSVIRPLSGGEGAETGASASRIAGGYSAEAPNISAGTHRYFAVRRTERYVESHEHKNYLSFYTIENEMFVLGTEIIDCRKNNCGK